MLLPFADLIKWCNMRQKHLEWTSQMLADKSRVPIGTINRIKGGEYLDCKYSTIKSLLIALIGGTSDEFSCTEMVERELKQKEELEKQTEKMSVLERENEEMKARLSGLDEQFRNCVRTIKAEYAEEIAFLRDELKARRSEHQR
jgi:predicted transcriptional regulator